MRAPTIFSHNGRFLVSHFEACQFHLAHFSYNFVGHFQVCQLQVCHFRAPVQTALIAEMVPSSGVDPGGGRGGIAPTPNKNIPGREYLFAPSKF